MSHARQPGGTPSPRRPDIPDPYVQHVRDIVEGRWGSAPLTLRHNPFGHRSHSYTARLSSNSVVIRVNDDPTVFASTAKNIEILGRLGIPVPEVITSDLSCSRYPFAYMILGEIPGVDLRYALPRMTAQQQAQVAGRIIEFERRVAGLPPGQGFGFVGIGEPAPYRTWREAITFGAFSAAYAPQAADAALVDQCMKALDHLAPHLDAVGPICFLDDLTTKNVIVDGGVLQGVIDFDVVCYGDPLFHIGLTQTAVGFDLPERCMSYLGHLCAAAELTAGQRQVVDVYAALCGVDFLTRIPVGVRHAAGVRRVEHWLARAHADQP